MLGIGGVWSEAFTKLRPCVHVSDSDQGMLEFY